jgi:hypothetical protein
MTNKRWSIHEVAAIANMSHESIRVIRHKNDYHYQDAIPMPSIDETAGLNRVRFCQGQLTLTELPTIFTDGGIW